MILIAKDIGSRELASVFPLSEVAVLSKLKSADFVFAGNGPDNEPLSIAIELKSLPDFISSVLSGRLHGRQSRLMLSAYDVNYLVIYGLYRCDTETGNLLYLCGRDWKPYYSHKIRHNNHAPEPLQYSFLQSCITSAESIGLIVKELPLSHLRAHIEFTREQLAYWIYCRYSWWSKRWEEHRSICQLDDSRRIVKSTSNLQTMGMSDSELLTANIAKELPGVQFDRALAIAKEFSSPRELCKVLAESSDTQETLAEIVTTSGRGRQTKLGKVRARTIDLALDGRSRNSNAKRKAE